VYYVDTVAIVVLEMFAKTTSKTPQVVLTFARPDLNTAI
jgi:phage-related protein